MMTGNKTFLSGQQSIAYAQALFSRSRRSEIALIGRQKDLDQQNLRRPVPDIPFRMACAATNGLPC